jgi:hypothetical protein
LIEDGDGQKHAVTRSLVQLHTQLQGRLTKQDK